MKFPEAIRKTSSNETYLYVDIKRVYKHFFDSQIQKCYRLSTFCMHICKSLLYLHLRPADRTIALPRFMREQTSQEQIITIIDNSDDRVRAPVVVVPFVQVRRWRYTGIMAVDGAGAPEVISVSLVKATGDLRLTYQC